MRDTEYWNKQVSTLTPYEFSSLMQVITDKLPLKQIVDELDMESLSEQLSDCQLQVLIEHLALRETIVDVLRSVNRSEWCVEGRREIKALVHKRKQLRLKLQEVANGNI